MNVQETILRNLPDAYYPNGTKSECLIYTLCDLFDPLSNKPNKEVKEIKNVKPLSIPNDGVIKCDKIILGDKYEISLNDGNLKIDEKK